VSSLSVIIPTAKRQDMLLRFIDSLNAQTRAPADLIIVDGSASKDQEQSYRARLRPEIVLRYISSEMGLTRQRNRGIEASDSDILFFFDDDVVLEPEYLAIVAAEFDAPGGEAIGAITGLIVNNAVPQSPRSFVERTQRAGDALIRRVFFLLRPGDGRFLPSGMPTFVAHDQLETDCECLQGCCMAFRRELVSQLKFDERLSRYCYMEDDDIARRVARRARVRYVPRARCEHLQGPANRLTAFAAAKMMMVNHHYLFRKNFPQDTAHRAAHTLSLFGYPLLMAWGLNYRRCAGSVAGLWSIMLKRDPLSSASKQS
jgi:GT2 family glycosyltransferase